MSIDARVQTVIVNEDGSGELVLVDRPARPGETPGIAGQPSLAFDLAPKEVTSLEGVDLWGGDSSLMLGDLEIARRVGYGRIAFCDRQRFLLATNAYYKRKRDEGPVANVVDNW